MMLSKAIRHTNVKSFSLSRNVPKISSHRTLFCCALHSKLLADRPASKPIVLKKSEVKYKPRHTQPETGNGEYVFVSNAATFKFGRSVVERELGEEAKNLKMKKVALFTDVNVRRLPIFIDAENSLKKAGIQYTVFDEVSVEPTDASFQHAAKFASSHDFDGFISVGGGSVMDTCKAANLYATHPADFYDYVNAPVGKGIAPPGPLKPHIAIPTTCGTGSELTGISIFDQRSTHTKTGIANKLLIPNLALIDPVAMESLPPMVVACSGFDVISHAIESYTARSYTTKPMPVHPNKRPLHQGSNPYSDFGCLEALRVAGKFFLRAVNDPSDAEAREKMLFASLLAGSCMGNAGVHLPHGLSYAVSGMVRDHEVEGYTSKPIIPHGMSVILHAPSVARMTAPLSFDRHADTARALGVDVKADQLEDSGEILAGELIRLMRGSRIPNGLSAVGFSEEDIPKLVSGAYRQKRAIDNAPFVVSEEDVADIFRAKVIQVITAGPSLRHTEKMEEDDGFPRVQLMMAYLLALGDSIALAIALPFVPEMCRERFGLGENVIGIAAGVINGSYSFALFLSSSFLGHISDEHGRRPVLLFGTFFSFICTLLFGLSTTLYFAVAVRILGGLTNSSTAVTKAVIADATEKKPQYRAAGYGYHGATVSSARAVCGALTGLTSGIILTTNPDIPYLSNNREFSVVSPVLTKTAYILPCIIGSSILLIAFVAAAFFLPETNKRARPFCSSSEESSGKKSKGGMREGVITIWNDPLLRRLNVTYSINSFANGAILTILPLYWSLSMDNKGLGFSTFQCGIAFSLFGTAAILFQVFFFSKVIKTMGSKRAYIMSSTLFVISSLLFPFNGIFYSSLGVRTVSDVLTWGYLTLTVTLNAIGFMTGLPLVSSMISNVSDPRRQGLVIGTAQSVSSFLRALGPVISGAIFSFSVVIGQPIIIFTFLASLYVICGTIAHFISKEESDRIDAPAKSVTEIEMEEEKKPLEMSEEEEQRKKREYDFIRHSQEV
ncbi:iron-containing alcohol dehydrogenase [Planoprotostelium fungivorum]|uniref:hydroxyacid-oxoacid transhydrogenase n=1 Tax=Planoprotostelium fungivorum TaxID=1890364 RepID=A0A2P6NAF9_9EUKA|nr:iron-containing alcohol dehydrogenase [Planoprotostelium fungivorum]